MCTEVAPVGFLVLVHLQGPGFDAALNVGHEMAIAVTARPYILQ